MIAYAPMFEMHWKFNLGLSTACWNDFAEDDGEQSHLGDYVKHAAACGSETNVKGADRFVFFRKLKMELSGEDKKKSRALFQKFHRQPVPIIWICGTCIFGPRDGVRTTQMDSFAFCFRAVLDRILQHDSLASLVSVVPLDALQAVAFRFDCGASDAAKSDAWFSGAPDPAFRRHLTFCICGAIDADRADNEFFARTGTALKLWWLLRRALHLRMIQKWKASFELAAAPRLPPGDGVPIEIKRGFELAHYPLMREAFRFVCLCVFCVLCFRHSFSLGIRLLRRDSLAAILACVL